MITDILALVIGIFGALLIVMAGVMIGHAEQSEPQPRKHMSFPRRRFLRKQARKADVH